MGRGGSKKLRADGKVPAIVYGRKIPAVNVELEGKAIKDLLNHSMSETILVDLTVGGEKEEQHLALVQEVQHHPLSGQILHVDFHQVARDEKVTVTLPVETSGEAEGVKLGGTLEHVMFNIKVLGSPADLPEVITVDVTNLAIGDIVHLGDLSLPEGVEALGEKSSPVFNIAAPLTDEQAAAALEVGGEAPAEPEVVGAAPEEEPAAEGDKEKAKAPTKG